MAFHTFGPMSTQQIGWIDLTAPGICFPRGAVLHVAAGMRGSMNVPGSYKAFDMWILDHPYAGETLITGVPGGPPTPGSIAAGTTFFSLGSDSASGADERPMDSVFGLHDVTLTQYTDKLYVVARPTAGLGLEGHVWYWDGNNCTMNHFEYAISGAAGPCPPTAPPPVVEPAFPVIRGTSWVGVGSSTSISSEPADDIAEHLTDAEDAHIANTISYVPTAPAITTSVQAALDALFTSGLTVEDTNASPTDSAVTKLVFPNGTVSIAAHVATFTPGGGGSSLTVEETDGSPTDSAVTKIVFPNGTLSIVGHVVTYTPASVGGGGAGLVPVMAQAPNLVTTDGSDVWFILTLPDGRPVMI